MTDRDERFVFRQVDLVCGYLLDPIRLCVRSRQILDFDFRAADREDFVGLDLKKSQNASPVGSQLAVKLGFGKLEKIFEFLVKGLVSLTSKFCLVVSIIFC
jgi:hypothetical protein